jgi:hypothetical protein
MKKKILIGLLSLVLLYAGIFFIQSCTKNDIANPSVNGKGFMNSHSLRQGERLTTFFSRDKVSGAIYEMQLYWRQDDTVEVKRVKTDSINEDLKVYNWLDTMHTIVKVYKKDSIIVNARQGEGLFAVPFNDSVQVNKMMINPVDGWYCWCEDGDDAGGELIDCDIQPTSQPNGGSYCCCEEVHCHYCSMNEMKGGGAKLIIRQSGIAEFSAKGIIVNGVIIR